MYLSAQILKWIFLKVTGLTLIFLDNHVETATAAPVAVKEDLAPTYSEAFPPLSSGAANGDALNAADNHWINPSIQKIKSTNVTQVGLV